MQPMFMGFSQRRVMGFRFMFEFDKRRVLVASKDALKILSIGERGNLGEMYSGRLETS